MEASVTIASTDSSGDSSRAFKFSESRDLKNKTKHVKGLLKNNALHLFGGGVSLHFRQKTFHTYKAV